MIELQEAFASIIRNVDPTSPRGGTADSPLRAAKAWKHFTGGYDLDPADILKTFEDGGENYNEMVIVKKIPLYSHCEHHLVPFFGVASVAYIPNGRIVGLSKINRVVDLYARRLQVQERLTNEIADAIMDNLLPEGVGVVIECRHLCMEMRGVMQQGHTTTTSALRGVFLQSECRSEFMELIK